MSRLVVGFLCLQQFDTAFSAWNELKSWLLYRALRPSSTTTSLTLTLILLMLEQELNQNLLLATLALDHIARHFGFLARLLSIYHGLFLRSLQPRSDNHRVLHLLGQW